LKEAALDSPSFRATAVHFADQVEIVEKWLDAYVKSISKLIHDVSSLEETFNSFLMRSVPPSNVSEAVLDHDYTLLAMKRFGEGSREWWSQVIFGMKKMDGNVVDPIRSFMTGEYVCYIFSPPPFAHSRILGFEISRTPADTSSSPKRLSIIH